MFILKHWILKLSTTKKYKIICTKEYYEKIDYFLKSNQFLFCTAEIINEHFPNNFSLSYSL